MLQFEPQTPGEIESEGEDVRTITRKQVTYAGREAQYFDGIKKLAAKYNRRATVLVLKHTDALIN